MGSLREDI